MTEFPGRHQARRRRRGEIVNPANTLDGLVAKRADDVGARDSLYKPIILHDLNIDPKMKRIGIDPDVSTRTCSVCGYQGKWVSEMIRHKRVHTNERPFRCKYCSRTSKWKADLVRHVAKTHGIRVVSKYSRSKTFHNSTSTFNMTTSTSESNGKKRNCAEILTDLKNDKDIMLRCRKPKTLRLPIMYRCVICLFEQDSVLVLMSHLKNAHNALPYECHSCGNSFMDAHTTMKHFIEKTTCKRDDLKINIAPPHIVKNNFNLKPSFALLDEAAKQAAQELFGKSPAITSSIIAQNLSLPAVSAHRHDYNQTENHMRMHTTGPSLLRQGVDGTTANTAETQMKVNADSTAMTQQVITTSRFFDLEAVLSVVKQQAAFDPLFSMRALALAPTLLSEWISPGPSAFKQVTSIPEEIIPVTGLISYPEIHGNQQKKTVQELNSLFPANTNNISCNSVTVISNFSSNSISKNLCFMNPASPHVPEESNTNSKLSDVSSLSPSYQISEGVIKAIQHYRQRRNAFFPQVPAAESRTQRTDSLPEPPEDKTNPKNESDTVHDINITKKDEDDFVDVVQLDG
ncbi:Zinc-finger double domain family protein [Brugia pahangi]